MNTNPETVSESAASVPPPLGIKRIVVPVDFSPHSRKAIRYALGFADRFGSEVILLHVMEQVFYPTDWVHPFSSVDFPGRCEALLAELRALVVNSSHKVETLVQLGRPWQEIIDLAKRRSAELIIIGTHGYGGLQHALLGSVTEKVVRHAPCPVLTVRPDERDFL